MTVSPIRCHHSGVGAGHFPVTKTLPKHPVIGHLTSLASGDIIDQTGRRLQTLPFRRGVCLETITKIRTIADGQRGPLSPVR